jgi:hypothetical protein
MYLIVYTLLSHEISKPILDWLLDGLEQLAWTINGKSDFRELWFDCTISNLSITPNSCNVSTDYLSTLL